MEGRGLGLAARFKARLDERSAARRREAEARERWLAEARAARAALLDDLAAVGVAIGHLVVSREGESVVMSLGERKLSFEPLGEADGVRVGFGAPEGEQNRLYREAQLKDRWVWSSQRGGREERLMLFDAGLEALLVRALGLPEPGPSSASVDPFADFAEPGAADAAGRKL